MNVTSIDLFGRGRADVRQFFNQIVQGKVGALMHPNLGTNNRAVHSGLVSKENPLNIEDEALNR